MRCANCGRALVSRVIPVCERCAKGDEAYKYAKKLHTPLKKDNKGSVAHCSICSNNCGFSEGEVGLCGVRKFKQGAVKLRFGSEHAGKSMEKLAALRYYYDPLPTNCCNSWFCNGSKLHGKNLALFYYGCNFDCLFCQNWEHKQIGFANIVTTAALMGAALREDVKCICHFGGSPEPQLPFAIDFSRQIIEKKQVMICWEWNGAANTSLALKAASISFASHGTVKFDLKAWSPPLHMLLTGRSNRQVLANFEAIGQKYPDTLSATTLLVPRYIDAWEVEKIAEFIAAIDENIPYSLLVFHPDYKLADMPITPLSQVRECYSAAKKHLKRVNIGNKFLLGISAGVKL